MRLLRPCAGPGDELIRANEDRRRFVHRRDFGHDGQGNAEFGRRSGERLGRAGRKERETGPQRVIAVRAGWQRHRREMTARLGAIFVRADGSALRIGRSEASGGGPLDLISSGRAEAQCCNGL